MYAVIEIVLFAHLILTVNGLDLPEHWKRCKISQSHEIARNKCIEKTMKNIITDLSKDGNSALGLRSLEPFSVDKMILNQNSRVANLALEFKNMQLHGFQHLEITRVMENLSSPKEWYLKFDILVPKVTITTEYVMNGNVMIFTLVGSGSCNITLIGPTYSHELKGSSIIKDGEEYLKITNHTMTIGVEQLIMDMTNLFNGNRLLEENMNRILNENWRIFYEELKPVIEKQMDDEFYKYEKKILERVVYKKMFENN